MTTFTKTTAERITKVYNDTGISANMISGMTMINGLTYCLKSKDPKVSGTPSFSVYRYDDYESKETVTPHRVENGVRGYGMTFSPYTKKLYIACDKKILALKEEENLSFFSEYVIAETSTRAITYYHSNMEIILADNLSTKTNFCFLIGKLGKGIFDKKDEFYVEKSNLVEANGYTRVKDIYYNGTNGLFIVTNYSDETLCKNRILRVSMKTQTGMYNDKPLYAIDEVIDIDFSTTEYSQCDLESMALDKYGRVVMVGNAVNNGVGRDWFFRAETPEFKMKTEINFTCATNVMMNIPDKEVSGLNDTVGYLSGMTMNGNEVYFVKNNGNGENGLYKYASIGNMLNKVIALPAVGKSFGMTYYNNHLYIAHRNCIGQYTLNGSLVKKFTCSGIDSITHLEGSEFIVMQYKPVNGKLYIRVWDLGGTEIVEKDWFTVESKGYTDLQDIYYHPLHGLFIVTQGEITSCKNTILRVDLTYYMKNRTNKKWNGANIPVASRWNIDFENYGQCYIESICINQEGTMLVACNAKLTDGTAADSVFSVTNITFRMDRPGIYAAAGKKRDIPSVAGVKCVPACLAKNGKKIYCITTNTEANTPGCNNESYFMETTDYQNKNFDLNHNRITDVAHCNGGAYHNGILYTCNYLKYSQTEMGMFLLIDGEGKATDRNKFNENKLRIDSEPKYYGAIAYFKDEKFLLVNYLNSEEGSYAKHIRVDLASFPLINGSYQLKIEKEEYITIENPFYLTGETGYLQDAHYEPGIGLFIGGFLSGVNNSQFVLRIDIDSCVEENQIKNSYPCEIYLLTIGNSTREVESMVMTEYGELLVSVNKNDSDVLVYPLDILFNREP